MTRVFTVFAVLLVTACAIAQATQVLYRSPRDMGRESSLVVQGTVESSRSYWNDTTTKILTETTVSVQSTYKGTEQPSVRVVQLGGVVGNVKMSAAGALTWRVGEEVILFLEPMRDGAHRVAGFSQGKFRVERDPDSGRALVRAPSMGGVELVGAPGAEGTMPAATVRMTVDNFIDQALGRR